MTETFLFLSYSDIKYYPRPNFPGGASRRRVHVKYLSVSVIFGYSIFPIYFPPLALRAAAKTCCCDFFPGGAPRRPLFHQPDTTHHRDFSATVCVHAAVVLSSGRVGVRGREAQGSLPLTDCGVCAVWRSSPTAPCFASPAPRLPALPIHAWPQLRLVPWSLGCLS